MIKLSTSLVALLLSSIAQAANIDIQWAIQDYPDTTANVGDTISFTWASGHNVYIHPTGTCDPEGAILVGETSPATYTFTADDVDENLFFVCAVSGHCDAGQTISVAVAEAGADATTTPPPSSVPAVSGSSVPSTPIVGSTIPSLGPSTIGGSGTQAPTVSSAARVSRAGFASAMLVWLLFG